MIQPDERQRLLDEEHLRLLRIAYLIHGGTYAAIAFFPLIYVVMGMMFMVALPRSPKNADPRLIGLFFVIIGVVVATAIALFAGLQLYAARCLRLRRSRALCLVAAVVACLQIPLGTALGVFTFIVLGRPSVQSLFTDGAVPRSFSAAPALPQSPPIS